MVKKGGIGYFLLFALAVLAQVILVGFAFVMGLSLLPLLWILLVAIAIGGLPLMLVLAMSGKRWQALGVPVGTLGIAIVFTLVGLVMALASGQA